MDMYKMMIGLNNVDMSKLNIPSKYKDSTPWIALEQADNDKDFEAFKLIYELDKKALGFHIKATQPIFHWNFSKYVLESET